MKRFLLPLISAAALFASVQAQATLVTVSRVSGYFLESDPRGGEYNVSPVIGAGYDSSVLVNGGFQTFCLERDEFVSSGGTYNASVNEDGIAMGGGNNVPFPDPGPGDQISLGTAWLYDQFTRGVLAGYDYNPLGGRGATAYALQLTIWYLEDENLSVDEANYLAAHNSFLAAAMGQFGTDFKDDSNGSYGIAVLNLTELNGEPAQDMLVRVPDGGGSIALLGMALLGVGAFRRRFSR